MAPRPDMLAVLTAIGASRGFWMLAFDAAVVIGPAMMPVLWSGNEIVYFDLALRAVAPDRFTDAHAMFDSSHARIAAMALIGFTIQMLGFEMAKTVLALATWALYALVLGALARLLSLRVVELSLALAVFLLGNQQLVGGEWIFGTVEPKVFAYIMVFAGLTAALAGRRGLMIVAMAAATYFHFLIGGGMDHFPPASPRDGRDPAA